MGGSAFGRGSALARRVEQASGLLARIPHGFIAIVGRFSLAAVFWNSGQTKVQGFAIDLVQGQFQLGLPHLSESALVLFRDEYRVPLIPPEFAAPMAALGEHLFSAMLLIGLATRFSALALLGMTAVIQLFVYPGAYPTHGTWAAVLLYLMARGPGSLSIDHWIAKRYRSVA
ncbi:MAG: DoxX family protein [Betaproteobacteria bacterium]